MKILFGTLTCFIWYDIIFYMKYSKELVQAIKDRILINAPSHPNDLVRYSIENLSISRNTALKYISELIEEKKLLRSDAGRYTSYSLPVETADFTFRMSKKLSEENIAEKILSFIGNIQPSAAQIFDYAFMEITNNAIEHSGAKKIHVQAQKSIGKIRITIQDDGIGIFKKIKDSLGLQNEKQAVIELSKGKFTSSPENHSGEGIFFSSKLCDKFFILPDGLIFSPQQIDTQTAGGEELGKGTKVTFEINLDTKKVAKEIFDEYAGFDYDKPKFKTVVQLRFMQQEGLTLTSRSQARRLLTRMEKFTTVVLDFQEVNFIGQAFADEIFRVYAKKHPAIKFQSTNESPQVRAMIAHVEAQ